MGSGVAAMAGAVVAPTPPPTAFEFSAADMGMALRRGSEVERFNELNRRQDELTDPELDELYGYRLRRLQARLRRLDRVRTSDDEGAIREALDDLESRFQQDSDFTRSTFPPELLLSITFWSFRGGSRPG